MEDVIREKFVPTLTDRPPPNDVERHLFSLPARLGGLAIPNPCDTSDSNYDASLKISNPLKHAILTHEFQYTYNHISSQMTAKAEIQSLRRQQATQALENLKSDLPEVLKRSVELASERGASSWLSALPISDFGFKLHKGAFCDALALRYGWPLSRISRGFLDFWISEWISGFQLDSFYSVRDFFRDGPLVLDILS